MSVAVAIHKWWQYKLEWQYTNATNIAPIVAIHVLVAIHQDDHSLCISLSHVSIAKYCDDTTTTINATTTNIPRRSLTASHYTRYYPRPQCHCLPLTGILFNFIIEICVEKWRTQSFKKIEIQMSRHEKRYRSEEIVLYLQLYMIMYLCHKQSVIVL